MNEEASESWRIPDDPGASEGDCFDVQTSRKTLSMKRDAEVDRSGSMKDPERLLRDNQYMLSK